MKPNSVGGLRLGDPACSIERTTYPVWFDRKQIGKLTESVRRNRTSVGPRIDELDATIHVQELGVEENFYGPSAVTVARARLEQLYAQWRSAQAYSGA